MKNPLIVGCMRFAGFDSQSMNHFIHCALDLGLNSFDHADIYGNGKSEEVFSEALCKDRSIRREDLFIQTKCGIVSNVKYPHYDLSKDLHGLLSQNKFYSLTYNRKTSKLKVQKEVKLPKQVADFKRLIIQSIARAVNSMAIVFFFPQFQHLKSTNRPVG